MKKTNHKVSPNKKRIYTMIRTHWVIDDEFLHNVIRCALDGLENNRKSKEYKYNNETDDNYF